MKHIYRLQIKFDPSFHTIETLNSIFGIKNKKGIVYPDEWIYEVEENEDDQYFDFINFFLSILEPNFDTLESLKIPRENITLWMLYEYDQQCNIEFSAKQLTRLGKSEISLNVSCWQK